ncbi:MAG: SirA family protein [Nitrospirae bacterium RIFCSPLOWO2_02_42_7]|nr:MAG: SirA family protein [Nitrospirae bacterium GWA2_42_11]OGW54156.1 MAG: SirA family protein [Nitrospirae bacterium RIFCSPLOWO2_02_42_7]
MGFPEKIDVTLDTLGQLCPMPIILTSKKMKEMKSGEVLVVLSDDAGIKKDMPAWCSSTKNYYIGLLEENKIFKVYVRKK